MLEPPAWRQPEMANPTTVSLRPPQDSAAGLSLVAEEVVVMVLRWLWLTPSRVTGLEAGAQMDFLHGRQAPANPAGRRQ